MNRTFRRRALTLAGALLPALAVGAPALAQHVEPGDRLLLRQWTEAFRQPDTIVVDPHGVAVFPRIGAVRVSGWMVSDVRDSISIRFGEQVNYPIDIVVLRRVIVLGAVRTPNVFLVDGTATVRDVIARAGGIAETGNPSKVTLVRGGRTIPMTDWEDSSAPTEVLSGDVINVGRRSWLELNVVQLAGFSLAVLSLVISLKR